MVSSAADSARASRRAVWSAIRLKFPLALTISSTNSAVEYRNGIVT